MYKILRLAFKNGEIDRAYRESRKRFRKGNT